MLFGLKARLVGNSDYIGIELGMARVNLCPGAFMHKEVFKV